MSQSLLISPAFSAVALALLGVCFVMPAQVLADERMSLSVGYGWIAGVTADIDEDELEPDRYAQFSIEDAEARFVRFQGPARLPIWIEYLAMGTEDADGINAYDRYQSLGAGVSYRGDIRLMDAVGGYGQLGAGAGVARFELDDVHLRAQATFQAEAGVVLLDVLQLGIGGSWQIVGYPGETIADAWIATLSAGLRF